ncbi:Dihydrolipoyllysine-residue succinyltransferase component of 2-oxoglutarate dehydrogenase complex,dihydrolipoamide succinyltransferase,dihydrolipoyllysine-residue succinyltransferase, E2 component of oxoglutarate dehydrogenase (succinyl-transferring) complex,2-oxoacid dehydrogenases acyltransferase (catalytic domain) [Chlamydia serpentis]|uniref:Dihydrolipoyllysine-residue succinyltransferase n=1 Tax=Chlamydia serpentis TaxID=1967782 RepID=A0A2R8FAT9_9CHLA|nr:dihydrolipoyllysine-residue succinyltransferase [Chlamydia serpentis]SPN73514.1 Dihydrolipoyllysine-residue succinyltransferase component of 2-oxoglutarate dehydrogenase complex,dihydrolipoamide succinyltransferase,dihydrolipoyllysine-residue succinyltransferase, E2 component of oxoglutarate dehydrogenase (succinyl-transferring) complex,2-oxoacid dehydrogenases acyltransferase (catalytic domain) [Chlamydia serpentis]
MTTEVRIPNIAESISEVTIASLLVPEGSFIQENQGLLEIESDKVNQLIYAPASGRILWQVSEGDVVAVGGLVARIEVANEGECATDVQSRDTIEAEIICFPQSGVRQSPPQDKTFVPLREEMKKSHQSSLKGDRKETRERMTSIRKTISRRLLSALHESAMLTTFNEVYMTPLLNLRKQKQEEFISKYGVKLGFMSFFVKAVLQALKVYPRVNAYIEGEEIVYRHYYDICLAVGTDRGLVVPVIRDCDKLSSGEIEKKLADLALRAREGQLSIAELEGGSFTITNGGVYGSLLSTPIINPPQVGILGMHKVEKRPIVFENEIIIADMMYIALSYDHRLIDGKEAVGFLITLKECIENPELLLDL